MPIDTLEAARRLQEGETFSPEQAERIAEVLSEMDVASATAEDVDEARASLKEDIGDAEDRLRTEMEAMEERLRRHLTTRIYGAAAFITAVLGILNYVMG
jgi:predicted  nucleic acid-binding Zn-ribbon protein